MKIKVSELEFPQFVLHTSLIAVLVRFKLPYEVKEETESDLDELAKKAFSTFVDELGVESAINYFTNLWNMYNYALALHTDTIKEIFKSKSIVEKLALTTHIMEQIKNENTK